MSEKRLVNFWYITANPREIVWSNKHSLFEHNESLLLQCFKFCLKLIFKP